MPISAASKTNMSMISNTTATISKNVAIGLTALALGCFLLFHFSTYVDIYMDLSATDLTMFIIIAVISAVTLSSMPLYGMIVNRFAWSIPLTILLAVIMILLAFNLFYTWDKQKQGSRITYLVFLVLMILLIAGVITVAVITPKVEVPTIEMESYKVTFPPPSTVSVPGP